MTQNRLTNTAFNAFQKLGQINLGATAFISDPCYAIAELRTVTVAEIKPGNYDVFVYMDPDDKAIVLAQLVIHEETSFKEIFDELIGNIYVDSGICGIADYDFFKDFVATKENPTSMIFDKLSSDIPNPDFIKWPDYIKTNKEPGDDITAYENHMLMYGNTPKISNRTIRKYETAALYETAVFTFSSDGSYTASITKTDNLVDSILLDFGLDDSILIEIESNSSTESEK